ncbi:MAG: phospho-sugar mutase, partial [Bacteroidota bacterium]
VGIAVKNETGEFQLLNGNQTGALLVYYLLRKWKDNGKLDGKQFIVKTIVTSDLLFDMADGFGVKYYETLTGFKFIAAVIKELEGKETFIGGGEESYGYLISDFVRDKDAIASCAFIAEMAAWAKDEGMSPFELLQEIYKEFGVYLESLVSITKKGKSGSEEIAQMMKDLRSTPPATLGGSKVTHVLDYQNLVKKEISTGRDEALDFPKSNVLQFLTADGDKISARPSGTEPKIKFYFSVKAPLGHKDYRLVESELKEKISLMSKNLNL